MGGAFAAFAIAVGEIVIRYLIYGETRYLQREIYKKINWLLPIGILLWIVSLAIHFGSSNNSSILESAIYLFWLPAICFVWSLYVRYKYPIIPNYMPPEEPVVTEETKKKEIIEQTENQGNWICKHCSTINARNLLYCKDCGKHK